MGIPVDTVLIWWPGDHSTVTYHGLGSPGIERRWRQISVSFRVAPRPIQPPVQWVLGLSWA